MTTDSDWCRDVYERSITRLCFASTPYDAGWDGDSRRSVDGKALQQDAQMRRLVEMETGIRPVPLWARKIAEQIGELAPCGWCFPQFVEAVYRNIGSGDAAAAHPCGCYNVGERRLQLMANYALCLDGWLKGVCPEDTAAAVTCHVVDQRDWLSIARKVYGALGEQAPAKALLVRRLLGRLRFWLRAPFGPLKADDNPRLGYLYTHAMGRYGGWDHFSFERHDPDVVELEQRIRAEVAKPDRWLELIESTWPCAPKVFRYLERIVLAIGRIEQGGNTAPAELNDSLPGDVLQADGTCMGSGESRCLFDTGVSTLAKFVSGAFPAEPVEGSGLDARFGSRLEALLGEPSPQKLWLAALLLKRVALFEGSFKSFHFTRDAQHVM